MLSVHAYFKPMSARYSHICENPGIILVLMEQYSMDCEARCHNLLNFLSLTALCEQIEGHIASVLMIPSHIEKIL